MPGQQHSSTLTKKFRQRFKEQFGREYHDHEPLLSLSEEEFEFVFGYTFRGTSGLLYQFTYSDPVTHQTYEVFYDVDTDQEKAVVAYALLDEKKVRLTRGLRQRMAQAAFEQWCKGFEEAGETLPALECAFNR